MGSWPDRTINLLWDNDPKSSKKKWPKPYKQGPANHMSFVYLPSDWLAYIIYDVTVRSLTCSDRLLLWRRHTSSAPSLLWGARLRKFTHHSTLGVKKLGSYFPPFFHFFPPLFFRGSRYFFDWGNSSLLGPSRRSLVSTYWGSPQAKVQNEMLGPVYV